MALRYVGDELQYLGMRREFVMDDFDYLAFKQKLMLMHDPNAYFDVFMKMLDDDDVKVQIIAIKSIYYLLVEMDNLYDENTNQMIRDFIDYYGIPILFEELGD